jgi:pterin-4a-carbinolamine dehydratase
MEKTARKNSHQDKAPKEQKTSLKRVEEPSLKNLDGWQLTDDHKMIYREFILHDFMAVIDLIDRIALIAEDEKHHPDIHLTQYRNLRVGLTTYDAGGLSEKDFIVARKIKDLLMLNKAVAVNKQLQNKKTKTIKTKKILNRIDQSIKKT